MGVPVDRVNSRNRSMIRKLTGPGFPSPIGRVSNRMAGITSAAVPVRKHSSAV
jgi:hypothetical protein